MPDTCSIHSIPYLADNSHYLRQLAGFNGRVWLDSGCKSAHRGRFDIISAAPCEILHNPSMADIHAAVAHHAAIAEDQRSLFGHLPFCGGAIGYFNYESRHGYFDLSTVANKTNQSYPSINYWGIYDWAIIIDHHKLKTEVVFLASVAEYDIRARLALLTAPTATQSEPYHVDAFTPNMSQAYYFDAIARIKEYILAGDCYQVNFAQRFSSAFSGSAYAAYTTLRQSLPSPYSAFIELGDETILSFSPEQFIEVNKQRAQTKPIKGTSRRGNSTDEDLALAQALQESEKNRAENLMIVDLLRNDFSQCCEPWSVQTEKLFALESFANVHHLVSTVTGTLQANTSALDFIEQCFPGGSITGAPKKRAMEIINELEAEPRHIYCGSIGYLSAHGRVETNIAIRTLLIRDQQAYCWGGGGIVADSTAEEEYAESIQKVGILMQALESGSAH